MKQIIYKQVEGYMEEIPLELDTESSKDVVYLRKDIEEVPNTEDIDGVITETTGTHWKYEESILTKEEYSEYISMLQNPMIETIMMALSDIQADIMLM